MPPSNSRFHERFLTGFVRACVLATGIFGPLNLASGCGDTSNRIVLLPEGLDASLRVANTDASDSGSGASPDSAAPSIGSGLEDSGPELPTDAGGCDDDADCTRPTPYCDHTSRTCVECGSDANCPIGVCDPKLHACTPECDYDQQCQGATPHCDDDVRRCVQCTLTSHCAIGQACQAESHTCVARCLSGADCAGGNRPQCAVAAGICVECTTDTDCSGAAPRCDLRTGSCVACLVDTDCLTLHCRSIDHQCGECMSNADCAPGQLCVGDDCVP